MPVPYVEAKAIATILRADFNSMAPRTKDVTIQAVHLQALLELVELHERLDDVVVSHERPWDTKDVPR